MKRILFVVYQSPVGTIWPNEAFRTAFGMYAEDLEPVVLLIDQACVVAAAETEPKKVGLLSIKMVQKYIDKYETKVIVEKESLEKYQVKALDEAYHAEILTRAEIKAQLPEFDQIIFM